MKKTILDNLAIDGNGVVLVRFRKQDWEGGALLAQEYHRTVIEPGSEAIDQMLVVNAHLLAMGEAQVSETDIGAIEEFVSAKRS